MEVCLIRHYGLLLQILAVNILSKWEVNIIVEHSIGLLKMKGNIKYLFLTIYISLQLFCSHSVPNEKTREVHFFSMN